MKRLITLLAVVDIFTSEGLYGQIDCGEGYKPKLVKTTRDAYGNITNHWECVIDYGIEDFVNINPYGHRNIEITLDNGDIETVNFGDGFLYKTNWPNFKGAKYKEIKFTGMFSFRKITLNASDLEESHSALGLERIVIGDHKYWGFRPDYLSYPKTMRNLSEIEIVGIPVSSISTEVYLPKLTSISLHSVTNDFLALPKGLEWLKQIYFTKCEIGDVYFRWDTFKFQIIESEIRSQIEEIYNEKTADFILRNIKTQYSSRQLIRIGRYKSNIRRLHATKRLADAIRREKQKGGLEIVEIEPPPPNLRIGPDGNLPITLGSLIRLTWDSGDLYESTDMTNWRYVAGAAISPITRGITYTIDTGATPPIPDYKTLPIEKKFYMVRQKLPTIEINNE